MLHSNASLVKASHMVKPSISVGGRELCKDVDARRCDSLGTTNVISTMFILIKFHYHSFERKYFFSCLYKIQIFLDMSEPGDDEDDDEEGALLIFYSVPGCSLHIYNHKKFQGQNHCSHFRGKKSEVWEPCCKFLKVSQLVEGKISTQAANSKAFFLNHCITLSLKVISFGSKKFNFLQ